MNTRAVHRAEDHDREQEHRNDSTQRVVSFHDDDPPPCPWCGQSRTWCCCDSRDP